ncbi:MAG TPA: hypothetical protein VJU61_10840 [Polyangiaceae bacterium]|nr:hypothetical protein [Polyangiaceae bacterium]
MTTEARGLVRACVTLVALCIGCNQIFDIEEGYPETDGQTTQEEREGPEPFADAASTDGSMPAGTSLSEPFVFNNWGISMGPGSEALGFANVAHGSGVQIEPDCSTNGCPVESAPSDRRCVRGHFDPLPRLPNGMADYGSNQWGAEIAISLSGQDRQGPWDRAGGRAIGLSFLVTGPQIPEMRLNANLEVAAGQEPPIYCTPIGPFDGLTTTVVLDQLLRSCWDSSSRLQLAPGDPIAFLTWNIPPTEFGVDFDFCVSDVRFVLAPE